MHLESLTTEPANIKMLSIDTPTYERMGLFDPDRDMNEEDWDMFAQYFQETRMQEYEFALMCLRAEQLGRNYRFHDNDIARFKQFVEQCRLGETIHRDWPQGLMTAAGLKRLGYQTHLTEDEWEKIIRGIVHFHETDCMWLFGDRVYALMILGGRERLLRRIDIAKLKRWLQRQKNIEHDGPNSIIVAEVAVAIRLLDGSTTTENDFRKLRRTMEEWRNVEHFGNFLRAASSLAMLSAERIDMTEHATTLHFSRRERQISPFPAVRKFASNLPL